MLILGAGGLGNQLFCLAMSLWISQKEDKVVWLLTNNKELEKNFKRAKKGSKFAIQVKIIYSPKIYNLAHIGIGKLLKLMSRSAKFDRISRRLVLTLSEPWDFGYDLAHRPIFLRGYFQNVGLIKNLSKENTDFLESMFQKTERIVNRSIGTQLVGMHARKGDYFKIPQYGVLSIDFFLGILEDLPKEEISVIISSDDKQFLDSFDLQCVISKLYPDCVSPWETIEALSKVDSLVMSNSTFSFWIGWLVSRRGGKVFAPSPWFKSQNTPPDYLYLETFQKVTSAFVD